MQKPKEGAQRDDVRHAFLGDHIMKRLLVFVFALSSLPAFAGSSLTYRHDTAVLEDLAVTPDNGGFNPAFTAVRISARVMVGANACAAQGLSPSMDVTRDRLGNQHVKAVVSGYQPSQLACPYIFDPVYANVSTTLRDVAGFESRAYIHHAYERDFVITAAAFQRCDEPVLCTREFDPQECTYQGVMFRDQNLCMTGARAKTFACLKGIEFNPQELACNAREPL